MGDKFFIRYITNSNVIESQYLKYPGDIYIEINSRFRNEDYAMDLLLWAEQAQPGDRYSDTNVIIQAL